MARAVNDFDPVAPDEQVDISFDFTEYLSPGDAIVSVVSWNCAVSSTSLTQDDSPSSRLIGPPTRQSDTAVAQTVGGCVGNVIYAMEALVDTVEGERLSLWAELPCKVVG